MTDRPTKSDLSGRAAVVLADARSPAANCWAFDTLAALRARGRAATLLVLRANPAEVASAFADAHILDASERAGLSSLTRALHQAFDDLKPQAVLSLQAHAHVPAQWAAWRAGVARRVAYHGVEPGGLPPLTFLLDSVFGLTGIYTQVLTPSYARHTAYRAQPRSYRKRLAVLHRGVPSPQGQVSARDARRQLNLPASARIALSAGPLTPDANLDFLLRVLDEVARLHLVIAADGPARAALEDRLKHYKLGNRVRLLGEPDAKTRALLLAAADLYVEPGERVVPDVALLEALTAGLPVLAADTRLHAETLLGETGGQSGLLLPPNDFEAWRTALDTVCRDEALRDRLGADAQARGAFFSLERMGERLDTALFGPSA